MTTTNRPIRRALVSVFHKEGIEVLAEAFIKAGTSGFHRFHREASG